MERISEFLGAACGLVMRVADWLTGKRKDWFIGRTNFKE
jgi:hypothetical protein